MKTRRMTITLTIEELREMDRLAQQAYPKMKRGARNKWLRSLIHQQFEKEISRPEYGGKRSRNTPAE